MQILKPFVMNSLLQNNVTQQSTTLPLLVLLPSLQLSLPFSSLPTLTQSKPFISTNVVILLSDNSKSRLNLIGEINQQISKKMTL